jgi:DNA-binding GntR family transcriptional regulator
LIYQTGDKPVIEVPRLHEEAVGGRGNGYEPTAAHAAYLQLKELIVTLGLPPGSTIHEDELQRKLGVSRTPVREALHRLAHDGMLHIYPRRAMVVAKLGLSEIRQLFEVRLALEPSAAALAAKRLSSAELARLRTLSDEATAGRANEDAGTFLRADQAFHRAVALYAQNALLAGYVDHLQTLNLWLWHVYFANHGVHRSELFAHEPIIRALGGGDGELSESTMRDHILQSKEQLLTGF